MHNRMQARPLLAMETAFCENMPLVINSGTRLRVMKILLVEDSRTVAMLMAARLNAFGHEAEIAENGQVALEKYCASAPDLVLMDIEMPVMNGFEATNRIRAFEATQQWAWTPIVFLTASDTPANLVTAIEAGGDDFIAKNVPEEVLQAKMKAMARIASLRQRLAVANRKLEEQASRDGLTGLCNRRYMDIKVDAAWAEAVRRKQPFGLLMLDVDNFKNYNDHYGHLVGDDCLRTIAGAIATVAEAHSPEGAAHECFAARYGGEEFAVILPNAAEDTCGQVAEEILAAVRQLAIPHDFNADWGTITVSIGGTRVHPAEGRIIPLFRSADAQLYRAKELGRNRAELAPAA